ncbi:MAG TPA: DsbA family protein [Ktedonobacterales bacterium]
MQAVRLHNVLPEYQGRVRLRIRPFPLEVARNEPASREILEQEWWLAALQEPAAQFAPYQGDDWPTTTLPAFEAVWCASQQEEEIAHALDLRIRRAFFAESRNIGRPEVLLELAQELAGEVAGLDLARFTRDFDGGAAREAVLEECRIGQEQYRVRGTPTLMLADGTKLRSPIAFPVMREHRVVAVGKLPCCGDGCLDATRALFERALHPET